MTTKKVAIIGAAGHVGLGLALSIADAGHETFGIDINEPANQLVSSGVVPFVEEGAEEVLRRVLANGRLRMSSDFSLVAQADVVIVILGTPIDDNLNPIIVPLLGIFEQLKPHIRKNQLFILRSTVSPGTTDNIRAALEKETGLRVGEHIYLVFAPERVVQGHSLKEIRKLPQLIGTYDKMSFRLAEQFFSTFIENKCLPLTPIEAELAKLMCNMARYITFGIANEFSLIADEYNVNIHRIFDACAYDYPRFNLPKPGPNVSGPCLFKDGFFLAERFPFPELILTAFKINESMPVHIFKKIRSKPGIRKVAILGMTFKAGSDDTRYSLSYKLLKLLRGSGYEISTIDPMVEGHKDMSAMRGCDCVVLMTPHPEFRNLQEIVDVVDHEACWYLDLWGFWQEMRNTSGTAGFYGRDVVRSREAAAH
jgi:UDP-N-acetyl-D-mannosaminuronic acid dehydrogenase